MAVEKCPTLKQGDCKNAFYQSILPDNDIMIIKPQLAIPMPKRMSIGYSLGPSMAYIVALGIG
jgi:hypothetical protein